jgi:hypothetical protein
VFSSVPGSFGEKTDRTERVGCRGRLRVAPSASTASRSLHTLRRQGTGLIAYAAAAASPDVPMWLNTTAARRMLAADDAVAARAHDSRPLTNGKLTAGSNGSR